jgi:hypothetical protein
MPTANYDSSRLTQRIQAKALYSFQAAIDAANASATPTVRRLQGGVSETLDVVTLARQGCCAAGNNCVTGLPNFERITVPGVAYTQ